VKELDWKEAEKIWLNLKKKDDFWAEHSRRVSEMSCSLARRLGWEPRRVFNIKIAGLLHDIGKIYIPDDITDKIKTGERLNTQERNIVRKHAGELRPLSQYTDIPPVIKEVILYHHEKFNGKGYPQGLKGEKIPVEVRLVSMVDYYDASRYQRSGDSRMIEDDIIHFMESLSGERFDPIMLDFFLNRFLDNEEIDMSKTEETQDDEIPSEEIPLA